ncbi:MAG: type 1 glutamine amidotransferase domain-containing protein [Gammaproteobacteria bacterium]|nr:type 1 glutamine amidotransferase domain-containing protein [Gammaproteobacteria bacterium]
MTTIQNMLIIVTSFGEISQNEQTGLWLEEFAVPYVEFINRGYKVTVASIKGGKAPIDSRSKPTTEQEKFWSSAIKALENTSVLSSINSSDFSAVLMPGGHGTMYDFPESKHLNELLSKFAQQEKIIASMCHGPASLVNVKLSDGSYLVSGKTLTSFTNEEESAAGFTEKVPFLLESRLRKLGAKFIAQPNWSDHVEIDGKLITGQNPQSSKSVALSIIDMLSDDLGE